MLASFFKGRTVRGAKLLQIVTTDFPPECRVQKITCRGIFLIITVAENNNTDMPIFFLS